VIGGASITGVNPSILYQSRYINSVVHLWKLNIPLENTTHTLYIEKGEVQWQRFIGIRPPTGDLRSKMVSTIFSQPDQAKIYAYIEKLAEYGHRLGVPFVKQIEGKIRELRIPVSPGNYRIFFSFMMERVVIFYIVF
jgi:hypothetical protein